LPTPPEEYVPSRLQRCGFGTLHIQHAHALRVAALPMHHRDPFDRMLIAQSQIDRIPIITVDRRFAAYSVQIVWG
jgi:PIN domain nuclease of toxin-antitoxin system